MPTWDVKLPKSSEVKFPSSCVGCGVDPTTTVQLHEDAVGWWSVVRFGWIYGMATGRSVAVPACEPCARTLRRRRRYSNALVWVIAIAGALVGLWLFREWDGLAKRAAVIGVVLVAAIPYMVWEMVSPATVDITVTDGAVWFHFTDRDYAERFAAENGIVE